MHAQVVVHEREVAILPRKIVGYFVRHFTDPFDFRWVERGAIAMGDRLGRIVAGIFPTLESGDELVEETALSVAPQGQV